MKSLHFYTGCLLFIAVVVEIVQPTCVLESDFGFKINCAFKKSGLFRVRNLGGVKAHASIGFSLGDELGFEQSLTNLDPSRRRSVSVKNGLPPNLITESARATGKQEKRGKQNRIMMRPPAPITRLNPSAMEKLSTLHRRASTTMEPIVVSNPNQEHPTFAKVNPTPQITMAKPLPMGVPPFKPLPPKEEKLNVLPISSPTRKIYTPLQIPQSKGPSLAYQSEHYNGYNSNYNTASQDHISKMVAQMTANHMMPHLYRITPQPIVVRNTPLPTTYHYQTTAHPFVPMPIDSPSAAISIIPGPVFKNSVQIPLAPSMLSNTPIAFALTQNTMSIHRPDPPISNFVDPVPHHVHQLATQLQPVYSSNTKKADDYNTISGYGDDTTLKFSKDDINEKIAEIAKAGNISMEAVEAAIALRQQQLLNKYANIQLPVSTTTSTTSTSTTTQAPLVFQPQPEPEIVVHQVHHKPKRNNPTSGKVMNAPREYYPVGYEKNFDDQFQSKVDLPETTFHCGDQKYFPGLYGDENLGCMVFHVCALTDDGLVMKSFLCPESTLFDQTILKCNWWFYVDCKSTRKLYDTNIPVSKSYQLMKALTFFSSYNKETGGDANRQTANPEDIAGIKEAITILENQDNMRQHSALGVQIVTPQPLSQTERNTYRGNTSEEQASPVYRINRNNRNITRNTDTQKKKTNSQEDQRTSNSEFKLITVNADMNYSGDNSTKNISSHSSKERQLRRRQTLRSQSSSAKPKPKITTTTTTSTTKKPETTPLVEIIKQEMQPLEFFNINDATTNDKPLHHIDLEPSIIRESESLPPVKRVYRSSAETSKEMKEITMVNDEKVQIIRPTSRARLVGMFATPTAVVAKLDEAILGKSNQRFKKEARLAIVTPKSNLSPTDRERT